MFVRLGLTRQSEIGIHRSVVGRLRSTVVFYVVGRLRATGVSFILLQFFNKDSVTLFSSF